MKLFQNFYLRFFYVLDCLNRLSNSDEKIKPTFHKKTYSSDCKDQRGLLRESTNSSDDEDFFSTHEQLDVNSDSVIELIDDLVSDQSSSIDSESSLSDFSVLSEISDFSILSDELLNSDCENDKPEDFLHESDSVSDNKKPISESEKKNYNVVDVVHDGNFDFKVDRNSVKFENGYGAAQTIVRVEIPKSVKSSEEIEEMVFAHLYSVKG